MDLLIVAIRRPYEKLCHAVMANHPPAAKNNRISVPIEKQASALLMVSCPARNSTAIGSYIGLNGTLGSGAQVFRLRSSISFMSRSISMYVSSKARSTPDCPAAASGNRYSGQARGLFGSQRERLRHANTMNRVRRHFACIGIIGTSFTIGETYGITSPGGAVPAIVRLVMKTSPKCTKSMCTPS
ncbi:hypothetical protein J2046_003481 [Rhizobium petrolearium]|nr:hypothetical protein [Neorhizobium petrolearium]